MTGLPPSTRFRVRSFIRLDFRGTAPLGVCVANVNLSIWSRRCHERQAYISMPARSVLWPKALGGTLNDPEALDKARQGLGMGSGINKVARQVGLSNSTVARLKAEMVFSA